MTIVLLHSHKPVDAVVGVDISTCQNTCCCWERYPIVLLLIIFTCRMDRRQKTLQVLFTLVELIPRIKGRQQ